MNRAAPVRIEDLSSPSLPSIAQEIISAVADLQTEFSVQALCDAASQQLGDIELYVDDGMLERMAVLCAAMDADVDLSPMGRMTNAGILTRYLVQRARLEDLYRRHPEIDDEVIAQPIIIAGLPRSGTTHLLNLISVDTRLRSLQYWESLEPIPDIREAVEKGTEDPRISRSREQLDLIYQIMPLFRNMHDMTPEHIHEEVELAGMDFSTMLFDTYGVFPGWRDYYLSHDQTPHYEFIKKALKALQWLRGPKRWILKSPQHVEQLIPLQRVFPDATYVLTHRDPVSVITSMATMSAYTGRMSRDPVRPEAIGRYWADRMIRQLQSCVAQRDTLPPAQTMDVLFHEFMADDVATVENIYKLAGHPMSDEVGSAMRCYMVENPRGKYGPIKYDLRGDFGLYHEELYEQVQFYFDRFPVQREHHGG